MLVDVSDHHQEDALEQGNIHHGGVQKLMLVL